MLFGVGVWAGVRGGFYTYHGLENLAGCGIHNVYGLRPELQQLEVSDTIRLHQSGFGPYLTSRSASS